MAVKYALGVKLNISSVPASKGNAAPEVLTTVALLVASADVAP
jgi:hypothetical protein